MSPQSARDALSTCDSCGARILWGVTERGKRIPLDYEPNNDGNVSVLEFCADGTPRVRVHGKASLLEPDVVASYMVHFATCPNSKHHRRR